MTGTFLNIVTVLIGTALGVAVGNRLPNRIRETVLDGLGLVTMGYAILNLVDAMSNQQNVPAKFIVVLFAVAIGGILGEAIRIDAKLDGLGRWLERKFARSDDAESTAKFVRGFVAASILFCTGPMTILGSISDGIRGDFSLIAIKSVLDMFAGLAFAASLGIGVGFSVITILVVQGGISLAAGALQGFFTPQVIAVLSAAGSLLIIGIALNLLNVKPVRVANLLPALVVGPLLTILMGALGVAGF